MQITLEADYAIRIVKTLAAADKRVDAKTIAEDTGVTLRFSLKILRKLVAAGILRSYKGMQGGYEIAKTPADITMCEVIEAIEGDIRLSRCLSADFDCSQSDAGDCSTHKVFRDINEMVRSELSHITFDNL